MKIIYNLMKYILFFILFNIATYSQSINTVIKKEHVKVTIRTMVNREYDPYNDYDFINVGAYDIRTKIYLNKNISIVDRAVITGLDTKNYFYSIGIVYKF